MEENQHYVSQLLLRNFSPNDDGNIHIIMPEGERLNRSIGKVAASETNYNMLEIDGKINNIFEKILGELETIIGRIFTKLKKDVFELKPEEWSNLLYYGAVLFSNSPNTRDKISRSKLQSADLVLKMELANNENKIRELIEKVLIEKPHLRGIDIDKHIEKLKKEGIGDKVIVNKDNLIYDGIRQSKHVFGTLAKMYWSFNKITDDSYFVTSDIPILPLNKNQSLNFNLGFEHSALVSFPITKKLCLVGNWKGQTKNDFVKGDYANAVNAMMIRWSYKEVYSPLTIKELEDQFDQFD